MEGDFQLVFSSLSEVWNTIKNFASTLLLPSRFVQLAVAVGCFVVAVLIRASLAGKLNSWIRSIAKRSKWQLRIQLVIYRNLTLAVFLALIWSSVGVFQFLHTFPSKWFFLELIATIATAWLAIRLASPLIRNRLLRRVAVWGLSIYTGIHFFGFTDETVRVFDSIAIQFGSLRLSLLTVLKALIVTGFFLIVARYLSNSSAIRLRSNNDISPSMQELSIKVLQVVLYAAAFFIGLKVVGFDLTGLAVLSGAIGLGLGFGLQKVVSNLVSGVIILLDKSIKPGDVISLGETFGWINSLSARYVSVVTRDGREYLIPNEDLITGQVVNWSHSSNFVRLDIFFGTAYANDPHEVRKLAVLAAEKVERVLSVPNKPVCHVVNFGENSVDYVLRFWISDPKGGLTNIRGAVYLALWDKFKENDISVPYPQREIRLLESSQAQSNN